MAKAVIGYQETVERASLVVRPNSSLTACYSSKDLVQSSGNEANFVLKQATSMYISPRT